MILKILYTEVTLHSAAYYRQYKLSLFDSVVVIVLLLFQSHGFVNWSSWIVKTFFKYLVGRRMYKVYHEELKTLQSLFIKNSDIHMHDTQQRGHYHIPLCRTYLGKSSLRYFGALLWNKILNADINPIASDFIFSRNLKTAICNNLL